ncbi:MAG: dipeptide/oligopeptide/nickel ABC transporter permease/ATP-binding protein [Opitutales bacterium]
MRSFFRNPLTLAGAILLALLVVLALITPILPLPDPNATRLDQRLLSVGSAGHLLGTDLLGRDILARLLWGMRISIAVAAGATLIAAVIGSAIGIVAGYVGGRTDTLLMRGIDMLMAFPYLVLALAIVAVLGPGLFNALIAIAVVNIPFFARTTRGTAVGLVQAAYMDAARLSGQGHLRILWYELLPNVLPTIIITAATTLGWMLLETAGLSFLGLGAQPPQADLGSMLAEGRKLMLVAPHVALLPGVVILAIVVSVNLLGDGLRDRLDPRLQAAGMGRPGAATTVDRHPGERGRPEATSDPEALLGVDQLRVRFGSGEGAIEAVRGVSFALKPGEALGLVGESGSGKSVTALALSRLIPSPPGSITGGSIRFRGEDILAMDEDALRKQRGRRIAYIFQDPLTTLNPLMSVGDQLVEAIRAHRGIDRKEAKARALELLKQVKMPDPEKRLRQRPHNLSGGQRQRIGIAMALANEPDLLVADEPTTALDVTVQKEVLQLLRDLQQRHHTALLFISHDLAVVDAVCDRVAVLFQGELVETGPARQVIRDPQHPYTRHLIRSIPVLGDPDRELVSTPYQPADAPSG